MKMIGDKLKNHQLRAAAKKAKKDNQNGEQRGKHGEDGVWFLQESRWKENVYVFFFPFIFSDNLSRKSWD